MTNQNGYYEQLLNQVKKLYGNAYHAKLTELQKYEEAFLGLTLEEARHLCLEVVEGLIPKQPNELFRLLQEQQSLMTQQLNVEAVGTSSVAEMIRLAVYTKVSERIDPIVAKQQASIFENVDRTGVAMLGTVSLHEAGLTEMRKSAEVTALQFSIRDYVNDKSFENFETLIADLFSDSFIEKLRNVNLLKRARVLSEIQSYVAMNKRAVFDNERPTQFVLP